MYRFGNTRVFVVLLLAVGAGSHATTATDFSWVRRMGGEAGGGDVTRVTMDTQENVYAVGVVHGQTAFGTNVLFVATNGMDSFISKLDRNGNWLWTRQITQSGTNPPNVRIECVAADSTGAVIVTGESLGPSNTVTLFGTNSLSLGSLEIFVAKYGGDGDCLWARGTGGYDPTYSHGVAVDAAGSIYVSGNCPDTNRFLVLKLDAIGNELLRIKPDFGFLIGRKIQADSAGNIYVCGALDPPVQVQGVMLTNSTMREAFVMKFSPTGALQWAKEGGGSNPFLTYDSWAYDLAVDSKTNLLVCGSVFATNLFGVSVLNTNYNTNAAIQPYLLKLTPEGDLVWLKTIPISRGVTPIPSPAAWGLGLDAADAAYVIGTFGWTAHFDSLALTPVGNNNIFFAKYDNAGTFQWAMRDDATNNEYSSLYDRAGGIAVGAGGVVACGWVPATGSFGSITFTNPPGWEMFVARIDFPPPQLGITKIGNNVQLCWPMVPAGYALESTTNLTERTLWQVEGSQPSSADGTNHLAVPGTSAQQYFRLHRL